jgi:GNAT superfamily N-acetyltransferase
MWWRLKRTDFDQKKGENNRLALKAIVKSEEPVGILAYAEGRPIGWCAVAPREDYRRLETSRILKPVDDRPVWAITCLFVARPRRRSGVTIELLKAAVEHVRKRGGELVEGYPVEPRTGSMPDAFAYTGLASAFRKAGFVEVLRRSETRPIMRFEIGGAARSAPRKKN